MKKYLRIYWKLFKVNQSALLMYRGNFLSSFTADIVWGAFNIISFFFITRKVNQIGGWSGDEILLLASSFNIISGIYFTLFSKSFYRLSHIVQKGLLDGILLRPLDSQFYISAQYSNITKIIRTILCIILNIYLLQRMNVPIHFTNIISFIFLVIVGVIILYSVSLFLFTLVIWNPELSNLYSLIWDYIQAARYPNEVFQGLHTFIFLFMLPVMFAVTTPTKSLLNKMLWGDVVIICLIASMTFILSRKFWCFSLRGYTSSSL